ncbi:MAG: outer membrane lipoprotein-sorting protein [Deltaproteobacteria bacterium]|nr:MAG: outer membrane lipoprotein-sorting protein [Deltaproteobacteria bacterium]
MDGSEALATLIIEDGKGHKRVRKTATVSRLYDGGKTEKRLIKFVSPPDVKGTGLLTYDYEDKPDDMWLYLPALRKTRRIVAAEKSKSFMGSEFSYADITPPPVSDFHHKLLGSEKVAGVDCWKIESIPRTEDIAEENGYSKKISFIGKDDKVIRKAIQYDLDGELHKELVVHEVKLLDPKKKRYRPIHMEMVNKQNGRRSVLKMDKINLRTDIPDDYFTTRYLERG